MITDIELGWLVGLLEGEGTFSYLKGTQVVGLRMKDKDVVERYASIIEKLVGTRPKIGCEVYANRNRSEVYYSMITGERARIIMRTVVYNMGYRRRQKIWQSLNKYHVAQKNLKDLDTTNILNLPERMVA